MRELKFRLWTGSTMIYNVVASEGMKIQGDIMQYTGITDIRGKEIYEGDIVRDYIKYDNFEISWNPKGFWTHYKAFNKVEVIGNIHQNKELLNEVH